MCKLPTLNKSTFVYLPIKMTIQIRKHSHPRIFITTLPKSEPCNFKRRGVAALQAKCNPIDFRGHPIRWLIFIIWGIFNGLARFTVAFNKEYNIILIYYLGIINSKCRKAQYMKILPGFQVPRYLAANCKGMYDSFYTFRHNLHIIRRCGLYRAATWSRCVKRHLPRFAWSGLDSKNIPFQAVILKRDLHRLKILWNIVSWRKKWQF